MSHYLLIDGNNVAFQSQAACMDKSGKNKRLFAGDQETTAINGFLNTLRVICLRFPDAKPVVLWDKGKAWRYQIYPEYKGNRKDNPTLDEIKVALKTQRAHIEAILVELGVDQISAESFEADDVAAALSHRFSNRGNEVTLVTRDQDWLQLVNDKVSWFDHSTERYVTLKTFFESTECESPAEFVEVKILNGDAGDNVSGIKGVGPVAAKAIIKQFGTADRFATEWSDFIASSEELIKGSGMSRARKSIDAFIASDDPQAKLKLNRRLMDLRLIRNSFVLHGKLQMQAGNLNKKALDDRLRSLAFISIASNLDTWIDMFQAA